MNTSAAKEKKLTSAELANLWNSYLLESMVHHIFIYFAKTAEDSEIKSHIESDIQSSRNHLEKYMDVFNKENLSIPIGTTSEDINLNAPRLFTDTFFITYIKNLAKFALSNSTLAYTEANRSDIRQLFRDYMITLMGVDQRVTEIMRSKGIALYPPEIKVPDKAILVEKESFFAGFIGEKRPLAIMEIKQLYYNTHSNTLGKTMLTGFAQAAKSKDLRDYFQKGIDIADKLCNTFAEKLQKDGISPAPSMEGEVLRYNGTDSPFSDRLMLNHVVLLNAYGVGNYGLALAQSQRHDLAALYGKALVEAGMYANNGAELLIQNKWMEQPPIIQQS